MQEMVNVTDAKVIGRPWIKNESERWVSKGQN
jgi:hypothetical protein